MPRPPRSKSLSAKRWKAAADARDRLRHGSFNHTIVRRFARGARPVDVCDALVETHGDRLATTLRPRDYICQRIYELRRRGVLVVLP